MDKFFKIILYVAVAIVIIVLTVLLVTKFNSCGKLQDYIGGETIVVNDTVTVTRYEERLRVDTTIKFIDRVVWKEVPAKIVIQQKIDSVFIERIKSFDFMLGLEKKNTRLRVFAVNLQDSLIKERYFENVGNDFTVYSKARGVFVKSKRFYWEGLQLQGSYSFKNLKYDGGTVPVGLRTGINYMGRAGLEVSSEYNFMLKEFETKITVKINLIQ